MLGRAGGAAAARYARTRISCRFFLNLSPSAAADYEESAMEFSELDTLISNLESHNATIEQYAILIRQCANLKSLPLGRRIHAHLARRNVPGRYLRNLVMEMYGKCGSPEESESVFRTILNPNVYSYTMLMLSYAQNGHEEHASLVFKLMDLDGIFPSEITFMNAFAACSRTGDIREARSLHSCLLGSGLESSTLLQTALLSMYTGCSRVDLARSVFDSMQDRSIVSWNAMLTAYAKTGHGKQALELFWMMEQGGGVKADTVTYLCLVEISEVLGRFDQIPRIQARVYETGYDSQLSVQTSILSFYGKHGDLRAARCLFEGIVGKNSICWNAMIGIYAQHGLGRESVDLYARMRSDNTVKPDEVTFINVLNGCANLGELAIGRMVHEDIISYGYDKDVILLNALLNMYGRCGSLEYSRQVFESMSPRIGSSWTVMMTQYAEHGHGFIALDLFRDMQIEGLKTDDITLVIVLSVCSHLGLLSEGRDFFFSVRNDFGLSYLSEHFGCMIDLLSRAGMLELAEEFLELAPSRNSPVSWTSLLNSCRIHGDVERGTRAASRLFELDPEDSGTYAILEQLYSNAGRWDDLVELARIMRSRGIRLRSISLDEELVG